MEQNRQGGILLTLILIVITAITAGSVGWSMATETQGPMWQMVREKMDIDAPPTVGTLLPEGVFSHGRFAGTRVRDGKNELVMVENGKEKVIDEGLACFPDCAGKEQESAAKYFTDFVFSPNGDYFGYLSHGWEWTPTVLYDLKAGAKVGGLVDDSLSNSAVSYGFTPDNKFLFVCSDSGMASERSGKIYSVPDFKLVFDVFKSPKVKGVAAFLRVECDQSDNKVNFRLSEDSENPNRTKVVTFDLASGAAVEF